MKNTIIPSVTLYTVLKYEDLLMRIIAKK